MSKPSKPQVRAALLGERRTEPHGAFVSLSDADREEAAGAVHELARITAEVEPDNATARTRLQRLRELLTAGADITQPALAIVTSVAGMLGA
ncbi:hypothetical protein ACWF2L_26860 [Streptomyces anulatus]